MARFIWAKYVFRRKYRDLFGQNSLPLQRFVSITATSVFNFKHLQYGTTETTISIGTLPPACQGEIDPAKQYLVQLEYTWNRQVIRKGMNIFVRLGDWNEKANKGRGGVRASYGPEANRINSLLLARADKIDGLLAEYQEKNPNQITAQVISDF